MTTMSRRTVLGLLASGVAVSAVPWTAQAEVGTGVGSGAGYRLELPRPTGPYPIATVELHLVDNRRQDPWGSGQTRELMVSVWYPAFPVGPQAFYAPAQAAVPLADEVAVTLGLRPGQVDYARTATHARLGAPVLGRRHPIILYSPGLGTSRILGTNHVEELASRGYVVVTIDHTGEAPVQFPDGSVAPVVLPTDDNKTAIQARVADTRFVLDALADLAVGNNPDAEGRALPTGLADALDLRRTGMFGYSAGGFTAAETMLVDRRIDAGVNLDGTLQYSFPQGELSEVAKRGLDRPFLLFGADGHSHLPGGSFEDPSWMSFWANQRGWNLDLSIPTGTHGAFADYQFSVPAIAAKYGVPNEDVTRFLGTVNPSGSIRGQRAYLTAFFARFLRGLRQPLLDRPSPKYPEVVFAR
ncbi:alpha/beta hydrolase family protein [Kribbella sp. NPDC049174]|uniref:alpha/beta hydrolase family protein n=1 Tax=Kribbella sp. NPDC049174 TaxID=3364112 RepID=UPI0037191636